jgi:hypothetical protein
MGGIWLDKETQDQLKLWLTRILVLSSFAAHLCLAQLASIRRREGSSWRTKLVWFAYQVTDKAPRAALGKLFLDRPVQRPAAVRVLGSVPPAAPRPPRQHQRLLAGGQPAV